MDDEIIARIEEQLAVLRTKQDNENVKNVDIVRVLMSDKRGQELIIRLVLALIERTLR